MRVTQPATRPGSWRAALVVLRTFMGIVYLTDGLAKLFGFSHFVIGPWSQYLINRADARGALSYDIRHNGIPILNSFARDFVLPHWDVIGWVVTAGELAVGVGLLLGILGRLAALGGLSMAFILFLWDLGAGGWTYDYLFDVVLLAILALTPGLPGLFPAGRRMSRLSRGGSPTPDPPLSDAPR